MAKTKPLGVSLDGVPTIGILADKIKIKSGWAPEYEPTPEEQELGSQLIREACAEITRRRLELMRKTNLEMTNDSFDD
jgi:hypothetical protein